MKRLIYTTNARKELFEATEWYMDRSPKTAKRFIGELEDNLEHIAENPYLFPKLDDHIRKANLKHFPYSLFYSIEKEHILIASIHHQSKAPRF